MTLRRATSSSFAPAPISPGGKVSPRQRIKHLFIFIFISIELAEVVSVSGVEVRRIPAEQKSESPAEAEDSGRVRVDFLDRAQLKLTKEVAVGDSVFAKRRATRCATYNWQPATVTQRPRNRRCVTVERPTGVTDESIPIDYACLQIFTADSRV
jgi:hypothetical protein